MGKMKTAQARKEKIKLKKAKQNLPEPKESPPLKPEAPNTDLTPDIEPSPYPPVDPSLNDQGA